MEINLTDYDIRKYIGNAKDYKAGEKIYKIGKVKDVTLSVNSRKNICDIKANIEKDISDNAVFLYETRVCINDKSEIMYSSCNCSMLNLHCEHVAALLFYIEHNKEELEELSDNYASEALFDKFNSIERKYIEIGLRDEEAEIDIVPKIEKDYGNEWRCTFQVGRDKMYVVKDIAKFLNDFVNGEITYYGKNLTIDNEYDKYSEKALKLIEFIRNSYRGYSYYGDKNSVDITVSNIDDLFETLNGDVIKFKDNDKYHEYLIKFVSDEIPIKLKHKKIKDGYELSLDNDIEYGYFGIKYAYFLCNSCLYRVTKEYYECIVAIYDLLESKNKIIVKKDDISKFATMVLPPLIRTNAIDDYLSIQVEAGCYPLKVKMYVDYENNAVSLDSKFCYGDEIVDMMEITETPNITRNIYKEMIIRDAVVKMGFECGEDKYYLKDEDKIYDFYKSGIKELNKIAEVYATDTFKGKEIRSNGKLSVGFRISGNLLELDFDDSVFDYAQLEDVLKSYKVKKKYHRFKDGSIIDFSDDVFKKEFKLLENLEINKAKSGHFEVDKFRALAVNSFIKENNVFDAHYNDEFKKLADDFSNFKNLDMEIPKEVEGVLRDYQKTGYKWLKVLEKYGFCAILADDMGLGKTIQAISLILSYKERKKPSIVVCPTSLIYNWQNEINKFAPSLKVKVIAGLAELRSKLIEDCDNCVYITTYDTLKRDIEQYKSYKFKYIIADEAQAIKNPQTQNAKAIKKLKAEMRVALTGTPIENSLTELWAIFDFVMPGYLYSLTKFNKNYSKPIVKENDENKEHTLKNMIMPFILRRVKSQVLTELPEKIESTLYASMGDEQKKIYMAYFLESKKKIKNILNESNGGRIQVLSILTRLRQICCHPSLFLDNFNSESGKLELTLETIDDLISGGHRILLFSQFTSMLDIIKKQLDEKEIEYFYLSGETKADVRTEMARRFNFGERSVFLISLKAGGTGLNLTGADAVIHYDPWWNPAVMNQASDRAHRIGQKNIVQVFNMIMKDTVEEKIIKLQEKKKSLTDNIITDGEGFFNSMSKEEILSLFEE